MQPELVPETFHFTRPEVGSSVVRDGSSVPNRIVPFHEATMPDWFHLPLKVPEEGSTVACLKEILAVAIPTSDEKRI